MTIYIPTRNAARVDIQSILETDKTLNGERLSLDDTVELTPEDFQSLFFPNEETDSTFLEVVKQSLGKGNPTRVVTLYYKDKGGVKGKVLSLGTDKVSIHNKESPEVDICVTYVMKSRKDNRVYIISVPSLVYDLPFRKKWLFDAVDPYPPPIFSPETTPKKIKGHLDYCDESLLTKLGMKIGFCYPCPGKNLIEKSNADIQIVLDGGLMECHKQHPEIMADFPINQTKCLGPNQGASFQMNYFHFYEALSQIFPTIVKVARFSSIYR